MSGLIELSVDRRYISQGIDGILLLGCKHGDDYQCHFIQGSELAGIRLGKVAETLNRLDLESDRVRMEQICHHGLRQNTGYLGQLCREAGGTWS